MSGTKGFTGTQIQCVTGSVVKKYDVKKRLGSGGFADVYLVKSVDSGKVYACKFISKNSIESKRHAEKIKSELKIHAGCGINNVLENKFIVEFGRYWDDKEYIYILMNHCCNGSLEGWLTKRRTTTEAESRYTIKQITLGVKYLHEKFHVIHRDLKLGNILFDENMNIKICDFGLAAEIKQEAKKFTMCGTPNYIAPEIASGINNSAGNAGHSYGVDVWAIGVMTYTLLFGTPPFQTKNIAKTCDKIKKSQFKFPWKPKISDSAKDLIKKILTVDADKRLTIKGILKHGFFKTLPVPKNLPECCLHRVPTEEELFPDVCATEMTKRFNDTCVNVVKFVDYSSKYGIGYILSNGFTGVLFNDNSSLILPINKVFIYFIDMNGVGTSYAYKQFANKQIDNASVKKRFEIFMQIAKVIWKDFTLNNEIINIPVIKSEKDIVYVRKWKRTDYAMIFKFNDQVIQTLFKDDTVVAVKSGSGSGSGSATKNEEDENNNSNSNGSGSGSGSKSTSVTFMRQHRNVFEQFPSYTQFKKEASREMQAYVEHIQFSLLNKEN